MSFDNCQQAYDAGYSDIPDTSPLYAKHLDRDNDGTACDNPPAGFTPHPTGTATTSTATDTGQLPTTGPGEVFGAGALLLAAGAAVVAVAWRRRHRFQA